MDAEKEKRFRFRARLEAEQAEAAQKAEAQPPAPTAPGREVSAGEALAPRVAQGQREGAGVGRQAVNAGLDALSLPGRTAASLGSVGPSFQSGNGYGMPSPYAVPKSDNGDNLKSRMADTQGKTIAGQIIRDPALLPSLASGVGAFRMAGKAGLTGLKALTAGSAAEGLTSATIHQGENIGAGRKVNAKQAALEAGTITALPGGFKAAGAGIKWGNRHLGRLAQELSGVSEETLRTYGSGFGIGAKKLTEASGKQGEIGGKLVSALDNLDDYLPEKDIVNQALPNLPAVNTASTIKALEGAKTPGALKSSRAVNAKIDELISDLAGAADESGNIPAARFREIRKEIDGEIGDAFGKESSKYVSALKRARHQMADDLVAAAEASGNPEYVTAMKSMADKLQKADRLSQFLGKSAQTREARAESFVSTLFGKNKGERQRAVQEMGEIFGEDFLAQSKLASMAAELGETGKAGIVSRQFTGRSLLGPGVAATAYTMTGGDEAKALPFLALSSPRIAAGTLAGLQRSGQLGRAVAKPAQKGGSATLRSLMFRPEEER